jgi:hypothetical protein
MTLATLSGCGRHQPPLVVLTLYHPLFFLFVFLVLSETCCLEKRWKKRRLSHPRTSTLSPHLTNNHNTRTPAQRCRYHFPLFSLLSSLLVAHSQLPHIPLRISSVAWYLSFVTGVSWSRELWQGEQADCRMFFEIIRLYDSEALGMAFCSALGAFCVCFAS